MQKNKRIKEEILSIISKENIDIYDTIEVLANVFIALGITYLDYSKTNMESHLEIADLVIKDIKENGETLPNSLARQGLIILSWLKSKENV